MMPYYQHIEDSSPNSKKPIECRTNGFHKHKTTNGKHCVCDVTSIQKSLSAEGLSEQQLNNFICDTKKLIDLLTLDPKRLEAVSQFVKDYNNVSVQFGNSDNLRLCDLSGTPYMGQRYMQESWEDLYLPKKTRMQVFGTLENTRVILPTVPWVILVGEDGCIYAYGEEELYLLAESLRDFVCNGKRNISKTYYYPESGDEEDETLQNDEEIQEIRNRAREFVNKSADDFEDFLSIFSS